MADPLRLGPWRHFPGVGWARTFTHCEVDGAQTTATNWRLWPPVEYPTLPLASGPETGLEGRHRADAAARALGWELEGEDAPEGFEPGPPSAPLRASLYWKLAQGLVHLYRVAVAGDGSLVCREMDVGGGFQPLASVRWDAHAPCVPPGPQAVGPIPVPPEIAAARALGWELEGTALALNWDGTASLLPDVMRLADLVLAFGRVNRVTRHPDGVRAESDAEHTLMLAFLALTLADQHPEWGLDAGRLAVLAMVHDLPEVYAGDTNTAGGLTPSQQADKAARERAATERLHRELPGNVLMRALTAYERQDTPEARFLRVLDKVLPRLTHTLNFGAALRELGMSVADMQAAHAAQRAKLFAEYPEWDAALGPLFDEAALGAEKAAAERERYDGTVKRVVDELRRWDGAP